LVLVLALAPLPRSDAATLVDRARLRQGPSKDTALLGWVEAGAAVTIESQSNGWYQIRTPDGQTGYVWQEHLRFGAEEHPPGALIVPGTTAPPVAAAVNTSTSVPPSTVASGEEPRPWAPTERPPDAAVTAELEKLRGEVARLATAQEDLARRMKRSERLGDSASDGTAGAAALFLAVGALVGAGFVGMLQRRRDRRPRLRL
jgi:hypothetical protein